MCMCERDMIRRRHAHDVLRKAGVLGGRAGGVGSGWTRGKYVRDLRLLGEGRVLVRLYRLRVICRTPDDLFGTHD